PWKWRVFVDGGRARADIGRQAIGRRRGGVRSFQSRQRGVQLRKRRAPIVEQHGGGNRVAGRRSVVKDRGLELGAIGSGRAELVARRIAQRFGARFVFAERARGLREQRVGDAPRGSR